MLDSQLAVAIDVLTTNSSLPRLRQIIGECWADNLARHDPLKGDDARTLGFTTAANISNRVLRDSELRLAAMVVPEDGWALVRACGYEIKVYKLPGLRASVNPNTADWTNSEAKERGARENTDAAQLALFSRDSLDDSPAIPTLRRLHLVHTADEETGEVVTYLGFPRHESDEEGPWFAVAPVSSASRLVQAPLDDGVQTPNFDDQAIPAVALTLRRQDQEQEK